VAALVSEAWRRVERAGARGLLHLPRWVLGQLAGRPIQRDGRTLDPRIQLAIRVHKVLRRPGLETLSPEGARAEYLRSLRLLVHPQLALEKVEDSVADGVPVRIYTPKDRRDPGGVLVYLHGGGGVIGDLEAADPACRQLAHEGRVKVVSVDYRLGPEHPFPAALEDALTVQRWAAANAEALGALPGRIGVGGDSFGGTLAALVAQAALTGQVAAPALALLLYPATDFTRVGGSRETFSRGFLLDRALTDWFAWQAFREPADRPRASPLLAEAVAGLGPTAVFTAGFDPLRDEGDDYAARLRAAGVDVIHRSYPSLVHAYISFAGVVPVANDAMLDAAAALRAYLA
jgi:acetyl esterase